MEFTAARTLAFDLLALHGLKLPVRWSKAKRQLGAIQFKNKVATEMILSTVFVEANEESEVKDLILHEIAHALGGCEITAFTTRVRALTSQRDALRGIKSRSFVCF